MPSAAAGLRDAATAGSAARVAAELLVLFDHVATRPDKLQWVHSELTAALAADAALDAALESACAAVAAAVDAQPASYDRHGYHNRQHFCEVALTAYGLCLLERLDVPSTQLVLLAALVHDVVHAGCPQPGFVQERASVESMRPLLERAGLEARLLQQLMALVLATDPAAGTAFVSAVCSGAGLPVPAGAPELAALVGDPGLARLARIVCEADVLPSIGLDAEHALRVQQRLAREWRRPLDMNDKLAFMDAVLSQGYVGAAFLPCVRATRAALSADLNAAVPG